jgi:hypothetical protein
MNEEKINKVRNGLKSKVRRIGGNEINEDKKVCK